VAEDLYRFGRQLAGAASLREVLDSALPRLTAMLRAPVLIVLPTTVAWRSIGGVNGRNRRPARASRRGADWHGICSCQIMVTEGPTTGADASAPVSPRWCWFQCGQVRGRWDDAVAREALDSLQVPNSEALFGTVADLLAQAVNRINLVDDLTLANRAAERESCTPRCWRRSRTICALRWHRVMAAAKAWSTTATPIPKTFRTGSQIDSNRGPPARPLYRQLVGHDPSRVGSRRCNGKAGSTWRMR